MRSRLTEATVTTEGKVAATRLRARPRPAAFFFNFCYLKTFYVSSRCAVRQSGLSVTYRASPASAGPPPGAAHAHRSAADGALAPRPMPHAPRARSVAPTGVSPLPLCAALFSRAPTCRGARAREVCHPGVASGAASARGRPHRDAMPRRWRPSRLRALGGSAEPGGVGTCSSKASKL